MSIHDLRQHLQTFYGGWPNTGVTDLVKRLPLRVMNSSVLSSLRWIESIGLPSPPHIILQTLRLLETHTQNLVQALSPQVRPLLDVNGRDAVFRILEVVESEIMKRIVSSLCSIGGSFSLLFGFMMVSGVFRFLPLTLFRVVLKRLWNILVFFRKDPSLKLSLYDLSI